MGVSIFSKWKRYGTAIGQTIPDPNPRVFNIREYEEIGPHTIVKVYYPNATNYGGMKVMLYLNTSFHEIRNETILDPHFLENKNITLLARFKPTHAGWQAAKLLAKQLS